MTAEQDQRDCNICGQRGSIGEIELHHIDGDPSNDEDENIARLCASCHRRVHGLKSTNDEIRELQTKLKNDANRPENQSEGGMVRRTITLPPQLNERINDRLEYGDNFSMIARTALREYFEMEATA